MNRVTPVSMVLVAATAMALVACPRPVPVGG